LEPFLRGGLLRPVDVACVYAGLVSDARGNLNIFLLFHRIGKTYNEFLVFLKQLKVVNNILRLSLLNRRVI